MADLKPPDGHAEEKICTQVQQEGRAREREREGGEGEGGRKEARGTTMQFTPKL